MPTKPVGHDFGMLQAIDERLAMYGWMTNTGVKFVVIVDMEGRAIQQTGKGNIALGLKNSDLTSVGYSLGVALSFFLILMAIDIPSIAESIHTTSTKPVLFAR